MKKEVFAIYLPSWHPDKHYEEWYGKGFSEWDIVENFLFGQHGNGDAIHFTTPHLFILYN